MAYKFGVSQKEEEGSDLAFPPKDRPSDVIKAAGVVS